MDSLPCPVQGLWLSHYSKDSMTHQGNQMCRCTLVCKLTHKHTHSIQVPSTHHSSHQPEQSKLDRRGAFIPSFVFMFSFPGIAPVSVQSKDPTPSHFCAGDVYMQHMFLNSHTHGSQAPKNTVGPLHTGPIEKREKKREFFSPQNFILCLRKLPKKALSKPICS